MKLTLLAIFVALYGTLSAADTTGARKPNIVVIVADDLGYADVQFNPLHPKEITTPNLDSLAKESVICRQGYVSGHVLRADTSRLDDGALSTASRLLHGRAVGSRHAR